MIHNFSTVNARGCRIAIIGNAGGGKTTLAQKLGKNFSLPVFHIDDLQWDKSWEKKPKPMFQKTHSQLIKLDNWIIDGVGNKPELYKRLYKANIIVFIDLPVKEHLRLAKAREKTPTETSPPGCSYEGMSSIIKGIIKQLNATLIPQLRVDIPKITKSTGATVYNIKQIKDMEQEGFATLMETIYLQTIPNLSRDAKALKKAKKKDLMTRDKLRW